MRCIVALLYELFVVMMMADLSVTMKLFGIENTTAKLVHF
jgi:hypothetical protein